MWRATLLAGAMLAMGFAFIGTTRAADEAPAAPSQAKLEKDDMKFVRSANAGGEMEVALGKLAAEKATNADVKAFGQKMVDDHGKANEELGKLASSKGVDLTKNKENRQKKIDAKVEELSKKTGADFDKAYVDDMVTDHEKDVKEFKKQSETAKDEDLKKWAAQTLPTLEEHLKMIKDIQTKVKG
jgi:putative membrane protein